MDLLQRLTFSPIIATLVILLLALTVGVGIFSVIYGLLAPPRGKPGQVQLGQPEDRAQLQGMQLRLDQAQIDVSALEYLRRSLTFGIPAGIGLFILVGSFVLLGVGIVAGFLITWTQLVQERDRKLIRYSKQLASACDIIRTSYGVNPSLKKALEAVAEYSPSPVKEDFQEILVAASKERFVEGLEAVADRRRSIVFDTIATSLIRANEASGEVSDMLVRLAESTRQNVGAFEEALTSQINARSNIQWGTYGPWMIFCVFRLMTFIVGLTTNGGFFVAAMAGFFSTPLGNVVALLAAFISIAIYRSTTQLSQRGLVVQRPASTQPVVRIGQKPMSGQEQVTSRAAKSPMSAQSHATGSY